MKILVIQLQKDQLTTGNVASSEGKQMPQKLYKQQDNAEELKMTINWGVNKKKKKVLAYTITFVACCKVEEGRVTTDLYCSAPLLLSW